MLNIYYLIILLIVNLLYNTSFSFADPDYQEQLIRVGISTGDFKYLEYPSTKISSASNFNITDLSTGKVLANAQAGSIYEIKISAEGFILSTGGKQVAANIPGPIGIDANGGHIKLVDIRRKGIIPSYKGKIEIVKAPSSTNKLSVVNILPMDEYLKGVVPNELPPSFGLEALKAQAVAARNYAIRPREKSYTQFDICDSIMCQVYFGAGTEAPNSNQAVEETAGLVALYNGEVITALYSSASGGFSENYESAFSDPKTNQFPAMPLPYLKGKHDLNKINDLSSENAAREFYKTSPPSFDVKSAYYRWNKTWTKTELEEILSENLSKFSAKKLEASLIKPEYKTGSNIGKLNDIKVIQRGKSGKVMALQIEASNGTWQVKKELLIRQLFTKAGRMLPSANIVFDFIKNPADEITAIKIFGGGFGHGVGMSQYGASYMSKQGYKFDKILQHYYHGITIGTVPVVMFAEDNSKAIKQVFYVPEGKAGLWVNNEGVSKVKLNINGKDMLIKGKSPTLTKKKYNISPYLQKGRNTVIFYPPDPKDSEGLSLTMWIEIFDAQGD